MPERISPIDRAVASAFGGDVPTVYTARDVGYQPKKTTTKTKAKK